MRFTKEKDMKKMYWDRTEKVKTKFLWFPVDIDGETRWLETVTIKYRVDFERDLFNNKNYFWKAWEFVDNVE